MRSATFCSIGQNSGDQLNYSNLPSLLAHASHDLAAAEPFTVHSATVTLQNLSGGFPGPSPEYMSSYWDEEIKEEEKEASVRESIHMHMEVFERQRGYSM